MPIAEDPDARSAEEPENDPFEGLVLDEDFVRAAPVKEQSGRARMLAARWQREAPAVTPPHGHPAPPAPEAGRMRRLRGRVGQRWQTVLIVLCVIGMAALGLRLGDSGKPAPAPSPAPTQVVTTPSSPADGTASPSPSPSAPKLI
ncbi:hypothetical protein [Kitasatospora sp. MMS16-BH015]|uniref:SCO2583/SCO2584 N-terminal domain-containing protein n=1 Tax=Kitasatospora sp. MMS16-BH015 TaxID=2018025 RepID=UPI0015802178|nr:hypothetical protein [Kitasatospora sp. MMS16-BH015]